MHKILLIMRTDVTSVREIPGMHAMGHTCANLNGDLLFVWGGTNDRVAYLAIKNSSIWIYETLTGYWRHRSCSGDCPPYLSSCASCLIGQKMYIFGGHSTVQDNWLNCLYCLDLETFIWTDVGSQAKALPTKPIRSDKNVAWSFGGKLYIFGGYGWSQIEHYLELLDCQRDLQLVPDHRWPKFGWNNQLVEYNPSDKTWRWPNYTGKCPSARAAHSGALVGNKYFVFGGRDSHERLNDLYTFDTQTFDWQQIANISNRATGIQAPLSQPIGHLLELRDNESNSNQFNDDTNDVDESHRQIIEEMHDMGVDENDEEDDEQANAAVWNLASSSSPSSSAARANISDEFELKHLEVNSDDLDEGEFEYPHPSHLLERWSLASNNNDNDDETSNICLLGQQQQQTETDESTQQLNMTASTQSILLINHPQLRGLQSTQQQSQQQPSHQSEQERNANQINTLQQQLNAALVEETNQAQSSAAPNHNQNHYHFNALEQDNNPASIDNQQQQEVAQLSIPPGRSFCSLTPISDNDMLLFGGVNSQDQNLDDCWLYNIEQNRWTQIDYTKQSHKLMRPRLWHTGSRTKQNEVIIIGGSCSDKIDEYCSEVLSISFEPKSLKRLALDTVSRAVRMKTILRTMGIPSTLIKLIKLRKQAIALTTHRPVDRINHSNIIADNRHIN